MDEKKKYHTFPRRDGIKLRDLLPMIRSAGYSNYDCAAQLYRAKKEEAIEAWNRRAET